LATLASDLEEDHRIISAAINARRELRETVRGVETTLGVAPRPGPEEAPLPLPLVKPALPAKTAGAPSVAPHAAPQPASRSVEPATHPSHLGSLAYIRDRQLLISRALRDNDFDELMRLTAPDWTGHVRERSIRASGLDPEQRRWAEWKQGKARLQFAIQVDDSLFGSLKIDIVTPEDLAVSPVIRICP
jgi:hypothetical protein